MKISFILKAALYLLICRCVLVTAFETQILNAPNALNRNDRKGNDQRNPFMKAFPLDQTATTVTSQEATTAITDAITEAETVLTAIEVIITSASAAKKKAEDLNNGDKKRANDAKTSAETEGKAYETATKEFVDEAKAESDKADEKSKSALDKATKAETDATDAKTEATNEKSKAESAKSDGADSGTGDNYSQKKKKGDDAKQNIEKAKTKAEEAKTTSLKEAESEIKGVETAAEKAEIALQKVKVAVALEKIKGLLQSVSTYNTEAEEKRNEAIKQPNAITNLYTTYSNIPSDTVSAQLQTANDAVKEATEEAAKVSTGKGKIETELKKAAEDALNTIKSISTINDAKKQTKIAEDALQSATTEESNAKNALSKVKEANEKAERAKYVAVATTAVKRAEIELSKVTTHVTSAEGKTKKANDSVNAIKEIQKGIPDDIKAEVASKLTEAENALKIVNENLKTVKEAHAQVEKKKKETEDALAATSVESADLNTVKSKSKDAETAATDSSNSEKSAASALNTVISETAKCEKGMYHVKVTVSVAKIKSTCSSAKQKHLEVTKNKNDVGDIKTKMEGLLQAASEESKSELQNQMNILKRMETEISVEEVNTNKSVEIIQKEQVKAEDAKKKLISSSTVEIDSQEATNAALYATNSEAEFEKTKEALTKSIAALNKIKKTHHAAVIITVVEKATAALNTMKKYKERAAQLHNSTSSTVNDITAMKKTIKDGLDTEIISKLSIATHALQHVAENVKRIEEYIKKAEEFKQTALSARTKVTAEPKTETELTVNAVEALAQEARTAATSAEAEEGKAKTELSNATEESKHAFAAKEDALQIMQKNENTVGKTVPQFVPSTRSNEKEEKNTEELKESLPSQKNDKQESKDGTDSSTPDRSPVETDEDKVKENEQKASAHQSSSDEVTIDEAEAVNEVEEQPKQRTAKPSSDSSTFSDVLYWKVPTALMVIFLMNLHE